MSLPVSQYEALLAEVRGLRRKAQRVQQLARPLIGESTTRFQNDKPLDYTMESLRLNRQQHNRSNSPNYDRGSTSDQDPLSSEDEFRLGVPRDRPSRSTGKMSVSSEPVARVTGPVQVDSMYHGAWPNVERTNMWNSEPASLGEFGTHQQARDFNYNAGSQNEVASVMSFASSSGGVPIDRVLCSPERKWSSQQLEAKMDVVHSLLSMLGSQEHVDMGETLLALSTCPESCLTMRQSGCIPLLVQLVQSDKDNDTRKKAAQALYNLVNSQPDEKIRKREIRVLKLLEEIRQYVECLKLNIEYNVELSESSSLDQQQSQQDGDRHPDQTIAQLMKLSFDEGHRQAICQLGGIHTIAALVEIEHLKHGSATQDGPCLLMRRYACMALTNLTFGDSGNKTLLCSFKDFMRVLIVQLQSPSDELRQVTASVLRNLSWRADSTSKEILREVGTVTGLMKAAMLQNKENTLKSILSALWNLSAHCTENKSEICAVEGGLGFIVRMLTYKTPSKSLAIIENAGGILRNISSQIAVRDDYRDILREHKCLHILLDQLKSPSLTIVSNACGTLWNLSAKNAQDQDALWQMGAPAMLRSLNHSKHKMIAMGSSAALKNLLSCKPQQGLVPKIDSTALSLNLPELPTLGARKQKALMQDLDHTLSETYENIDKDSPVKTNPENNSKIVDFIHGTRTKTRSRSPEDLPNAFASLNLNEPSTSYAMDVRPKSKIPQNYGGSSLPYVPQSTRRSNPASFLPVRAGKFSDHAYEDDTPEQPIDYSRKYSETSVGKASSSRGGAISTEGENDRNSALSYTEKESDSFNIGYTETDLDQPTDYSLRYAEDDSDSDICEKIPKQEYVQDTVKTYCTEGTPYETPFVFSNATSMSDLRNVGANEDKPEINNDIHKNNDVKDNKEIENVEEKDRCSTEDISEMDNAAPLKPQKSEFSSGMMSPEKPVNYCEEGTPGYFSRVSSFGSGLDSIPQNEPVIVKKAPSPEGSGSPDGEKLEKRREEKAGSAPKTPNEGKVVKFEQVVNYAEQTPLMFSRSSSLASLDSIEQHSIHDDRSSIVSDFSRLTSGIVSPSELPDSPTQTVPSSPRASKQKLEFPGASKSNRPSTEAKPKQASQKGSIFEDNVTKFKEESTPMQFSTATSLSSLTIDDHEDGESPTKTPETKVLQQLPTASSSLDISSAQQVEQQEKMDNEKEKETSGSDELNDDDSDDDEDILAACISDGMQSNISVPTASSTPTKLPMSTFKYQPGSVPVSSTGIPMMRRIPPRLPLRTSNVLEDPSKGYFNEDTSVELNQAGTNNSSEDQTLSKKLHRKESLSSLSSLASNEGDQALLEECIYSGMPTDKQEEALLNECIQAGMPVSRSSSRNYNLETSDRTSTLRPFQRDDFVVQNQSTTVSDRDNRSKNVNVASVAGSTVAILRPPVSDHQRPDTSTTAAGVEDGPELQSSSSRTTDARTGTPPATGDTLQDRFSLSEENLLTDQTKSGSSKSVSQFLEGSFENDFTYSNSDNCANIDHVFAKSCEESVDNRMLDPDAMIESLDRFTAELVSQASHLNKEKLNQLEKQDKSKVSTNEDDTWNDDSSRNELTFPTMSGSGPNVITFGSEREEIGEVDVVDGRDNQDEGISNDFSSMNTTTMTESTLIAIEAGKMVTVFKKEAEMSQSTISAKSLDLDSIKPPSQLNSLTNSLISVDKAPKSPKLASRKKSLPGSLLVKRALSNSLNHSSSLESLENINSLSNIEQVNPPSELHNLGDMDNSIASVASLPPDVQPAFAINEATTTTNGEVSQDSKPHPIFNVKQNFVVSSSGFSSLTTDLEMINPPSIFNDITDMCNSLADVASEVIGTETSIFEDCFTHPMDSTYIDNTLQNDITEFSDANSVTPIQSDVSSAESTPKRPGKPVNKSMMTKQRRNIARDRYKTYVVAAEKVMQESIELETKAKDADDNSDPLSEDYQTVNDKILDNPVIDPLSTYTVTSPKFTPKERREMDSSRYETQVLSESSLPKQLEGMKVEQCGGDSRGSSASPSPTRSKLSIRRNFLQKRLENKERFRTQTLSESSFGSPELSSASPPCESNDIHSLVAKEANLVLKTIRDSKLLQDEMLDSETLSLVSNDEDSEHNSVSSINYRTYHRSWSSRKPELPVVSARETNGYHVENSTVQVITVTQQSGTISPELVRNDPQTDEEEEEPNREKGVVKPKIVKPSADRALPQDSNEPVESDEQTKGIRGRRKPLYSKTNFVNKMAPKTIKPARNVASNLIKNVTSSIKSGASLKNVVASPRPKSRPPVPSQVKSSGYGMVRTNTSSNSSNTPSRSTANSRNSSPKSTPPLERQGTFTKDDSSSSASPRTPTRLPTPQSKIPSLARQIPTRSSASKIPSNGTIRSNVSSVKSSSADRTNKNPKMYNRSTSADSREPSKKIQPSSSTQSLKNELKTATMSNGALKKSGIPSPAQRSNSNVSIASSNGSSSKKQVTSKIASLWKKVEESKAKQQPVQDKRVWIQKEKQPPPVATPPKLIRSNTFENKPSEIVRASCAIPSGSES